MGIFDFNAQLRKQGISVYDAQINELGIVDMFSSLIWTPRFYSVGTFELKAPMTKNNVKLLQKHRYLRRNDVGESCFIKSISEHVGEDGKYLLVSGDMVKGLLNKRTIALPNPRTSFSLNQMMSWMNDDSDSFNRYDKFLFNGSGAEYMLPPSSDMQNLGEYTENMLRADGRAFRVELLPNTRQILCTYTSGVDRSTDQEENPHVIFSVGEGNLYNTAYNYSEEGCYNFVRCSADTSDVTWSETTGTAYPLYVEKSSGDTGLSRSVLLLREKPVIIEKIVQTETGSVTVYVLDYDETRARQQELVNQHYCEYTENFTGTAYGRGYRKDWFLGDYATVEDTERGAMHKKQIEEVQEVFEGGSYSVNVTFGDNLKTIFDLVKEAKK